MKIYVAVTDKDWFQFLGQLKERREVVGEALDEVNFWQPGGKQLFKTLQPGDLFLFKLHSPDNFIVGGGYFGHASLLPASLAWEAFGQMNGAVSFDEMQKRIAKYRRESDTRQQFTVGCILLQSPFFLDPSRWIPAPTDFHLNIVQGKGYDDASLEMARVLAALGAQASSARPSAMAEIDGPMFGDPTLVRQRLGQGTFRVLVTDTYERRCAITRERTLPTLEAAHILPVGEGGRHRVDNGLLLRSDVHRLFDAGYVTRGASLKTFFVGQCVLRFANVYRRWHRELHDPLVAQLDRDALAVDLGLLRTQSAPPDEGAYFFQTIDRLQPGDPRVILGLTEVGHDQEEIALRLGTTVRGIQSRLFRLREKAR